MATTVSVQMFKHTRLSSPLKHTGIWLQLEDSFGEIKNLVHEVTGGTFHDAGDVTVLGESNGIKSSLILRPQKEDEEATYEDVFSVGKFTFDPNNKASKAAYERLFKYSWDYDLFIRNCRDHVIYFLSRLESFLEIPDGAINWVNNIKTNDALIGTGIGLGIAILGGYYLLSGSPKKGRRQANQSQLPPKMIKLSHAILLLRF